MGEMTNIMPTQISAGRVLTHPGHKPALAASTVGLADGRITAMGPTAAADDGLLLMPPLIDARFLRKEGKPQLERLIRHSNRKRALTASVVVRIDERGHQQEAVIRSLRGAHRRNATVREGDG